MTGFFVGQWGRHAQIVDQDGDINVVVIGDQSTYAIARQLAGWADAIEIVEPAEVRDELARIGDALVRQYAAAAVAPGS